MELQELKEFEEKTKLKLPSYIKHMLKFNGYGSSFSIATITTEDIKKMEIFVRTELPDILEIETMTAKDLEEYFGIYGKTDGLRKKFKVQPGHLSELVEFVTYCREKRESEKPSQEKELKNNRENEQNTQILQNKPENSRKNNTDNNSNKESADKDKETIEKLIKNYISKRVEMDEDSCEWNEKDIEIKETTALVKCILCEKKISIQLRLFKNGSRSWTITNWCNHFSTHTKKRKAELENILPNKRQLTIDDFVNLTPSGSIKVMGSDGALIDYPSFRIETPQKRSVETELKDPHTSDKSDSGEESVVDYPKQ